MVASSVRTICARDRPSSDPRQTLVRPYVRPYDRPYFLPYETRSRFKMLRHKLSSFLMRTRFMRQNIGSVVVSDVGSDEGLTRV